MRNLFQDGLNQMWFNAQKMEADEREEAIKMIIKLNPHSSGFVDYHAKFLLATMIDKSECYHNSQGYQTKVKEFESLGWYDEKGRLDCNKVMQ